VRGCVGVRVRVCVCVCVPIYLYMDVLVWADLCLPTIISHVVSSMCVRVYVCVGLRVVRERETERIYTFVYGCVRNVLVWACLHLPTIISRVFSSMCVCMCMFVRVFVCVFVFVFVFVCVCVRTYVHTDAFVWASLRLLSII